MAELRHLLLLSGTYGPKDREDCGKSSIELMTETETGDPQFLCVRCVLSAPEADIKQPEDT